MWPWWILIDELPLVIFFIFSKNPIMRMPYLIDLEISHPE